MAGPQRVQRTVGKPKARRAEVEALRTNATPRTDRKGRMHYGDNDRVVDVTFAADYAGTPQAVQVDLDHVPTHFKVEMADYDDDTVEESAPVLPRQKSSWTAKTIYVACLATTLPVTVRLVVY